MDPKYLEALATLETANGQKTIKGPKGEDSHNLYNVKDFTGKGFRALDRAEGSNDAYRVYASRDEATADLLGLLSRKYPKALEATTGRDFAMALKDGGYATDPQYVEKFSSVYDRIAGQGGAATPLPVPTAPARDRSIEALLAAAAGPRGAKAPKLTQSAKAAQEVMSISPLRAPSDTEAAWFTRSTDSANEAQRRASEAANQSLLDISRAQFMSTFAGDALKRLARPEFTPDGFVPTEDDLVGHTIDEQDALRQATSRREFEHLKFEIEDHKDRMREASKSGAGWAVVGGLLAGAPEGYAVGALTSLAMARTAFGSARLMAQGRSGAAAGSLAAENIGSNVALTAAQDYLSPFVGTQDYVIGALGGGLSLALHSPQLLRASRSVEADVYQRIIEGELASKQADIASARAALGPDASREAVAAKAAELQAGRLRRGIEDGSSNLGEDRQLISREINDELFGEKVEGEAAAASFGFDTPASSIRSLTAKSSEAFKDAAAIKWNDEGFLRGRLSKARKEWRSEVSTVTNGRTFDEVSALPPGVHVSPEAAANPALAPHINVLRELAGKYLGPDSRVYIGDRTVSPTAGGEVISVDNVHMIGLSAKKAAGGRDLMHTAMHELGHAIFHENAKHIPADLMAKIRKDYAGFLAQLLKGDVTKALEQRVALTSPNAKFSDKTNVTPYVASFDEYLAEQYVKHLSKLSVEGDTRISSELRGRLVQAMRAVFKFFQEAGNLLRARGLAQVSQGADEFFKQVLDGTLGQAKRMESEFLAPDLQLPSSASQNFAARTDADIMRDYGLDTLRTDTPAAKAELKAMVHLYRKAEAYPMPDQARMSKLLQSAPLQAVAPTALKLLQSANPVARMAAAELLESGSGAAGRRQSASIAKYLFERQFMGNAINDFQRSYVAWRNANGGNLREDFLGGTKWTEFNRRVAVELESRLAGRETAEAPAVKLAADTLTQAYERMRTTQQRMKTPGWAALPPSSDGYMPHRMSAGKVRAATPDQVRVLHGVLKDQFETIEGFDSAFSDSLASKYIDIMRKRGTAGYTAPIGIHNAEAADIVEQAAQAMNMSRDEAQALAKRVLRAAPAHTRHRLQLDLTRTYEADGKPFQLLDLFETDQLTLLRSQSSRVSGEAALVRHGIMGSTGLKLIRRAMDFGTASGKADNATLEAFDQVSAEFLGQPFGSYQGLWLQRAVQFNSLASLGGMGFNQLAETLNGAITLGARHALASVGSFKRLRSEIIALSKGQQVDNPIIGSIELYGGAEFGTDAYKMVFPFDMPDRLHETFGTETLTAGDRLLRGGVHLQGKLSLWRAITSAQQRGMAEQIVHKAMRYIREGKDSVALADMGIDDGLAQAIRAELANTAKFSAGRLVEFDITKMENRQAADAFVQAVHRGTQHIIQGTFIGETGKWAHHGLLKLLTQFKTFSLIAIDKQWNRQVGNHGTAAALGMLLGTMSFAAPIYMIRAGIQSIGRPDQDEYLEKRLHPVEIARNTLNYVALSGLSGDLLDAMAALAGYSPTGGRSGANKSFVGNVVAPAVGKVDDIWGAVQNTKEGTDVGALLRELPFANLPYLYPAMNALRPE
jgi:hypothetical protein